MSGAVKQFHTFGFVEPPSMQSVNPHAVCTIRCWFPFAFSTRAWPTSLRCGPTLNQSNFSVQLIFGHLWNRFIFTFILMPSIQYHEYQIYYASTGFREQKFFITCLSLEPRRDTLLPPKTTGSQNKVASNFKNIFVRISQCFIILPRGLISLTILPR